MSRFPNPTFAGFQGQLLSKIRFKLRSSQNRDSVLKNYSKGKVKTCCKIDRHQNKNKGRYYSLILRKFELKFVKG